MADSPLTSTRFSDAYSDVSIVNHASNLDGMIDQETIVYLSDLEKPLDVKAAVINTLGWNIDGQENSFIFLHYLINQHSDRTGNSVETMGNVEFVSFLVDFIANMNGEHLFCYAYLLAMDDYFEVSLARMYASLAADQIEESFTAEIVRALIHAQYEMDGDWCSVYRIIESVDQNERLNRDMRPGAVKIILDYTNRYSSYCD